MRGFEASLLGRDEGIKVRMSRIVVNCLENRDEIVL